MGRPLEELLLHPGHRIDPCGSSPRNSCLAMSPAPRFALLGLSLGCIAIFMWLHGHRDEDMSYSWQLICAPLLFLVTFACHNLKPRALQPCSISHRAPYSLNALALQPLNALAIQPAPLLSQHFPELASSSSSPQSRLRAPLSIAHHYHAPEQPSATVAGTG